MSLFAIIGSGFGLYGYLPALIDGCSQQIVLPKRYQIRFNQRSELASYAKNVQWETDEIAVLERAEGVVLALRPLNQKEYISSCIERSNIKRLLLEKPLAPSPDLANEILDELIHSQKVFRIGYNFRYTDWGKNLIQDLSSNGVLIIHWSFLAHHFSHDLHNWKRFHPEGGGVIRFYGIHIIALLAEIGYRDVTVSNAFGVSPNEPERWTAVFAGTGLPECRVEINTKSMDRKFHVEHLKDKKNTVFANLRDPFEIENQSYPNKLSDLRVPVLMRLCRSLWERSASEYELYKATIHLWYSVENKTQVIPIKSQCLSYEKTPSS